MRAFVLGAGLGKRLRPLTDLLPKPLIPVWHRPLMSHAFDHLASLGVDEFVVNTHHLPEKYGDAFPGNRQGGRKLHFRNEPVLLETGGGLANVSDLLRDEPFAVYNGDILTDLPLQNAWKHHLEEGNLVTLILRNAGDVRNVAFDPETGKVLDLRNALATNHPIQTQFTGLYFVNPDFFEYLIPGKIESVVEGFLRAIQAGKKIGGMTLDEGNWWDLGDPVSYLKAHAEYSALHTAPQVHFRAEVSEQAILDQVSCVGDGGVVAKGARLTNTICWPGSQIGEGASLENCIVTSGKIITGVHANAVL